LITDIVFILNTSDGFKRWVSCGDVGVAKNATTLGLGTLQIVAQPVEAFVSGTRKYRLLAMNI